MEATMRVNLCCKIWIGLVVLMSLGSGICQEQTKIEGGAVKRTANTVQGSFKITAATSADGILSKRLGGACLLADLNEHLIPKMPSPRTCSKDSECQSFDPANGEGDFHGYCNVAEKKCWVRPGIDTDLCNRSKDYDPPKPWDLNSNYPSNKSFSLVQLRYRVPMGNNNGTHLVSFMQLYGRSRWIVAACLNGINSVNGQPFCQAGAPDPVPPNTGMFRFGAASDKLP